MDVFWRQGYGGASVQDLLDGMKINRGSLYDTFGDKRTLFVEALGHYRNKVVAQFVALLDADGSPRANIRRALEDIAGRSGGRECKGCMLTNSAVEAAPHDAAIAKAVRETLGVIEQAFARALARAAECGELNAAEDHRVLARFLVGAMQGLVVLGKTRMDRATMGDVIRVTLSALD